MPDPYRALVPAPGPQAPEAEVLRYQELRLALRRRDAKAAFDGAAGARYLAWLRSRFHGETSTLVEHADGRLNLDRMTYNEGQRTLLLTIEQDLRAVEGAETPTPTAQVTEAL